MPHSRKRKPLFTPNAMQLAALVDYAEHFGDRWKKQIVIDWIRAGSRWSGAWGLLQQVRNNAGPGWLEAFELPASPSPLETALEKASVAVDIGIDLHAKAVEALAAANSLTYDEASVAIIAELTDALAMLDAPRCRLADALDLLSELAECGDGGTI